MGECVRVGGGRESTMMGERKYAVGEGKREGGWECVCKRDRVGDGRECECERVGDGRGERAGDGGEKVDGGRESGRGRERGGMGVFV